MLHISLSKYTDHLDISFFLIKLKLKIKCCRIFMEIEKNKW